MKHYHFKGNKPFAHSHEGGHLRHQHKGLIGYGRTKRSLRTSFLRIVGGREMVVVAPIKKVRR